MQSPVDIQTKKVEQDPQLLQRPLSWQYVPNSCRSLLNTGESWRVQVDGQDCRLTGGPLQHTYQLVQFHCHWGKCCNTGSEHVVDGKGYAAEIHLVHWNVDLYNNADEATKSSQGLSVIGIFCQVGEHHEELAKVTDILHDITRKGEECNIAKDLDPGKLLPEAKEYWTYEGSLTTPPFCETVTWIVFKNPIAISEEQLEKFRNLDSSTVKNTLDGVPVAAKLVQNVRPTQALNDRVIRQSPY